MNLFHMDVMHLCLLLLLLFSGYHGYYWIHHIQQQVRRCYEIFKFSHIDTNNEAEYKAFRLEIKRRLYKIFREELAVFPPASVKPRLQELYLDVEQNYRGVLARLDK